MNVLIYWRKTKMRRYHRGKDIQMYSMLKQYTRAKQFRFKLIEYKTKLFIKKLKNVSK